MLLAFAYAQHASGNLIARVSKCLGDAIKSRLLYNPNISFVAHLSIGGCEVGLSFKICKK